MPRYDYICVCGNITRDIIKKMKNSSRHKCIKCGKRMKRLYDQQNNIISIPYTFGHWMDTKIPKNQIKSKEEINNMRTKRKRNEV